VGDAARREEAVDRGAVDLLDFSLRAKCPKCRGERFDWKYVSTAAHLEGAGICPVAYDDKGEHLDLVCDRCGYAIGMKTADDR
jgi:predicted nucleic-acid-binding Zn-ribbon protein